MRQLLVVGGLLLVVTAAHADISSRAGTATAQFLKLEMGARYAALGGTYSGYGSDVFSLWGQPAAIATAPSAWQIGMQHTELFQGIDQQYIGITGRLGGRGRAGLVVNTVGVDGLLRTTENQAGQFTGSGGEFGARDLAVGLHYGLRVSENLAIGGAGKWIKSEIDNVEAHGFAADLGARYNVRAIEGLTIGASVTNLGTGLKFIRTRDDFPIMVRLGAAYQIPRYRLLVAADVVKSIDRDIDAGAGIEWRPIDMLKLRAGYRTQGDDVGEGLTAGIGFNFAGLELDYAYVPFGPLGDAHRVSAGYTFGGGAEEKSEILNLKSEISNPIPPRPRILK